MSIRGIVSSARWPEKMQTIATNNNVSLRRSQSGAIHLFRLDYDCGDVMAYQRNNHLADSLHAWIDRELNKEMTT